MSEKMKESIHISFWLLALIVFVAIIAQHNQVSKEEFSCKYEVLSPDEITEDLFDGKTVVVENCVGKVVNSSTGDGEVLNTANTEYNYISYRGIENFKIADGDIILSAFYYGSGIDDIIEREDFLLQRGDIYGR